MQEGRGASGRPRLLVGPLRCECERLARVRHHERLPVVVRVHQLVQARQHLVERARLVDAVDREGRHAPECERGDGTKRAEAYAGGAQLVALAQVHQLARAGHEPHALDLRGEVPEAAARAVGGGRDGTRECLWIHVALVLHREAAGAQLLAEVAQA